MARGSPTPQPAYDPRLGWARYPIVCFRPTEDRGPPEPRDDDVATESPLELRLGPTVSTVLLRTPGADGDLVRGFLFAEGLIQSPGDIVHITQVATGPAGDVLEISLLPELPPDVLDRPFYSSSSCGACGKRRLEDLALSAPPLTDPVRIPAKLLGALPDLLKAAQTGFARTGGMHASGLFTAAGDLVVMREDVGRHNALDKVIGHALAGGLLPLTGHVLVVSGRVSFELAQKAVVAGAPVLVAVGAPSSLSIDIARAHGLTLVGFTRPTTFNVYAHGERVIAE